GCQARCYSDRKPEVRTNRRTDPPPSSQDANEEQQLDDVHRNVGSGTGSAGQRRLCECVINMWLALESLAVKRQLEQFLAVDVFVVDPGLHDDRRAVPRQSIDDQALLRRFIEILGSEGSFACEGDVVLGKNKVVRDLWQNVLRDLAPAAFGALDK